MSMQLGKLASLSLQGASIGLYKVYLSPNVSLIILPSFNLCATSASENKLPAKYKLHSPFLSLLYIYYIIIFKICQLYPSKSYIYEDNLNLHRYNKNLVELDKC